MAPRRLGVIGSFVWDEIHGRDPRDTPVQEWGGITYALSALDAALPSDWEVVPLVKVGFDMAAHARDFLSKLQRMAPDAAPIEVPHPNNRVVLRYSTAEQRCEQLTGGVPKWHWLGLKPLLKDLDALYINLISGFELDLETAQLIRQSFQGPIYCDLHSLLLATGPDGMRIPQPLPAATEWYRCFDFLQVNEQEAELLAPDPMTLAATAFASGVQFLAMTAGSRGVIYFAAPGFERLSDVTKLRDKMVPHTGPIRTAKISATPSREKDGDPTGCGDVWGATYFSRLLAGETFIEAIGRAMVAAARNVDHKGATGLAHHLRGELSVR